MKRVAEFTILAILILIMGFIMISALHLNWLIFISMLVFDCLMVGLVYAAIILICS